MAGIPLECACVCVFVGMCAGWLVWGKPQTFELAIPVNSFTNINTHVSVEEALLSRNRGGPGDYKANLRTDRGHLCPPRTPRITDPRRSNEGRTAPLG